MNKITKSLELYQPIHHGSVFSHATSNLIVLIETVIKLPKPQKNSKGELCRWAIKQEGTGKILSRHKTEAEAKKRLKQIQFFKHKKWH